jgi:zinc D-Ala-D-Ala dipeptidase
MKRFSLLLILVSNSLYALPKGFVYLYDYAPSIIQEMRYASAHNFIGRPIKGYHKPKCILTKRTARQLAKVQASLLKKGYSLKVYDCYRPKQAVFDFYQWSKKPDDIKMKSEFYPREIKSNLFNKGYISKYSGHSRGSTVDLTIVNLKRLQQANYTPGQPLSACHSSIKKRFNDNSIDMGTGFDCLDKTASVFSKNITKRQRYHRYLLRKLMMQNGFYPYSKEWWHFTLRQEPFRRTYFNFKVV